MFRVVFAWWVRWGQGISPYSEIWDIREYLQFLTLANKGGLLYIITILVHQFCVNKSQNNLNFTSNEIGGRHLT